eukprot:01208.XXX_3481_3591_1 [CDS] Oithona nana genome sequencing.
MTLILSNFYFIYIYFHSFLNSAMIERNYDQSTEFSY